MKYALFLRGINVGGNKIVKMAAWRALLEERGYRDVTTYLQSGNAVFEAYEAPKLPVLEAAFEKVFGFTSVHVLRTGVEIAKVVAGNAFPTREDHAKLHVLFAASAPAKAKLATLPASGPVDEFVVEGKHVYVYYGEGAGRSKLKLDLGVEVTARNWRTVLAVHELLK